MLWDIWFLLLISAFGTALSAVARWGFTDARTASMGDSSLVAGGFARVPLHNRHRVRGWHRAR
ncbi:hypothetical protein [Nocardia aurantiaca]|uniref:Uncharacterized protein n=1 Tax=Nocardia aurantiaca TaxID=2675850 RepID=A0A6I3L4M2_9NOCA|nr:hypothetical protein [Nocardia aurantiaca]MTE15426.1 hypothetical protein [Nocardia aurantiaca]